MPRIDPLQLLNCLNVLLTPSGGIKSEHEVARISSLMEKFSKKLVSKCVYLLILKSSDIHLLSKFMGLGGWNLIYNWLLHAVEAKNYPFLIELLEVIIMCPVDIERLKSNPMPRQIKYLSKDFTVDSKVRDLASDIVKHWLAIVKGTPATAPPPADNVVETVVPSVDTSSNSSENYRPNEIVEVNTTELEKNQVTESRISSGYFGEEVEDNYVKSTSPSSSSLESDESDVFVPYRKTPIKKKMKLQKAEKSPLEKDNREETPKLKSKLISIVDCKESSKTSIKLKIEKKKDEVSELKLKKGKEKTIEEKLREKRKLLKEEKEKEKFAKFIQERGKKEKYTKDKRDSGSDSKSSKEKSRDEKLKSDLSKFIPKPLDKLGRIPKITKDADKPQSEEKRKEDTKAEKSKSDDKKSSKKDEKSAVVKPKESEKDKDTNKKDKDLKKPLPVVPPKKPVSMSVEVRESKPKTVKAKNSKFRLTGLEQELIPKPPSRKSLSSNSTNASNSSGASSSTNSPSIPGLSSLSEKSTVKRSPPKDLEIEPAEKKLKSPDVSLSDDKPSPVSSKTKKPFLQESDFLMNAMNTAIETQKELRKKKKSTQKVEGEAKPEGSPSRKNADIASSPTAKSEKDIKPAFKFYKDTLDLTAEEETADTKPVIKNEPMEIGSPKTDSVEKNNDEKDVKPELNKIKTAVGLKSSLSIFRGKKHPKKAVRWKQDDELESVQFFEVDVSERTNVVRNFWDMQMMERTKERESMLMARKIAENDKMAEQTKWRTLIPVDVPPSSTARGVNSQEKNIQYARERMVPPTMSFQKIPDTPAEPDLEIHPVTVPPVIPLDDISGSQDSVNDFSSFKWPEPKQYPPENGDMSMMNHGFMGGAGMPPPMFPFPDGTFPPPFGQPFFPGGPVGPVPVPPANWTSGTNDQNQQNANSMPINWPNVVPSVGPPGMMGPPPFNLMAPPFPPIPGPGFPGAPNMFPPVMNQSTTNNSSNSDNQQFSNNNFSNNSENGKKWSTDDRYYRKESWKNSNYSERSRDRRSSSSWRGSGSTSRLCRTFQKKGFCNVSGCRFYHPDE